MIPVDDYPGEVPPRQLDDATVERLLAGRAGSPELEPVATVVRALREVSTQPVEPSAVLRQQMATGVFTGGPAYSYRPASPGLLRRGVAAAVTRAGRARLAVNLAAAGVAAGVLGTATAGFAGSLPDPVQDQFENVVESVTPYRFAEKPGGGGVGPATDPGTGDPGTGDPGTSDPDERGGGVSEDARDGGVDGPEVSERARERDRGRPTDLPTPAQQAPGQEQRPAAPPGQGD